MEFDSGLDSDNEIMSEINMTPLVDVMLVLLIIFIIAMPLLTHTVKVDLPEVKSQPNQIGPASITLSVNRTGQIYWDRKRISMAELKRRLLSAAQQQPQPEIHLHGDRQVEYEYVVRVMSEIRLAGIQKLGFITLPDGE